MARPVTVDFHAHAQSPKATELISSAPNNPGAEANPHNQMLARTRYHAAFTDLNVRLALKYAVDRKAMVEKVELGFGSIGNDLFGKGYPSEVVSVPTPQSSPHVTCRSTLSFRCDGRWRHYSHSRSGNIIGA